MSEDLTPHTAMLLGLGLREPEASLWQTMLANPGAGVDELAAVLSVSAEGIRTLLDALADRALIRASKHKPGVMLPVAAEAGLNLLLRQRERIIAEHRKQFETYRDQVTDLIETQRTDQEPDQIERLLDPDAIQARFEQLAYSAHTEVQSMMPGGAIDPEVLELAWPLDSALLSRGVQLRLVYQEAIRNDPPAVGYMRRLAERGASVRTSPLTGQRLFICDREIALLPIDPHAPGRGAIFVNSVGIVASLVELFEHCWAVASPLQVERSIDPDTGLTDTERELLSMLADGMTDEAAAKRLDLSLRTIRRMMADIMARLGAKSRFEAGCKAVRRGWL